MRQEFALSAVIGAAVMFVAMLALSEIVQGNVMSGTYAKVGAAALFGAFVYWQKHREAARNPRH
jgi:hypothetical protein